MILTGNLLFHEIPENTFRIPHDRNRRQRIFSDLRGINVDMDEHFISRNDIRLVHRPVRHPRADHNQKIRFIHGTVCAEFSVISDHTEIHRMLRRHSADTHHRRNHRHAVLFCKTAEFFSRIGKQHAAPRTDQRLFRPFQLLCHFLDLYDMALYRGFIGAHGNFFRICKILDLRILDIDRHIDQDRAFPPGICDMESFLEHPRNIIYVFDQITVFYKGLHRPGNIRLLKNIAAEQFRIYLPGNTHKRNTVRKSRGNTGDHIGRAGTGSHRADPHLSGHSRKPVCRMGCVLLRSDQDRPDITL